MPVADKMIEMIEKSSMIRKMFEEGAKLKAMHGPENVYDFSLGNPDVPPPPEFNKVLKDLVNDDNLNHGYTPSPGLPQVRKAVADPKPGTMLTLFTFIGEAVRDAFDPKKTGI